MITVCKASVSSGIQSDSVINSGVCTISNIALPSQSFNPAHEAISMQRMFEKNISFLKKGFTPEIDNTMEQIFSLTGDVVARRSSDGIAT